MKATQNCTGAVAEYVEASRVSALSASVHGSYSRLASGGQHLNYASNQRHFHVIYKVIGKSTYAYT